MLACPDTVTMELQHAVGLSRSCRSASVTALHSSARRQTDSNHLHRLMMITGQVLVGQRPSVAMAQYSSDRQNVTPQTNVHDSMDSRLTSDRSE